MRRKDREITEKFVMEEIIQQAKVCHVGFIDGDIPYVIPLSFGYENDILYLHGASKGKRLDVLKKNANVCFEVSIDAEFVQGDTPWDNSMYYRSVIGTGKGYIIEDHAEKIAGLNVLLKHYNQPTVTKDNVPDAILNAVGVIKVEVKKMTGKQHLPK